MKRSIIAAAGLVALAGCSDVKGPEVEPAPSFSQQEDQGRAASPPEGDGGTVKVADMAARKWFRISINATPTLRPDALIGVTVTYTANFATDDADLFVTLPEVEAAEGSGWDERYRKPVGTQRPVKAESNHSLVAGGRVTHSISFKVPVAGIYRVHATARSNKTAPDETSDRTQQSAYKTLWLLVDESGGRTLDAFDPDAIPDEFIKQPGPFRKDRGGRPRPAGDGSDAPLANSAAPLQRAGTSSCRAGYVCMELVYDDEDLEETQPLPGVKYEYAFIDPQTGYKEWGTSGYADSNGEFEVACPGSNDDFEGRSVSMTARSRSCLARNTL